MSAIPSAVFDARRLEVLNSYDILDTGPEPGFEDIVTLARELCHAPIALISFVAADRQWFKASAGLGACETPIEQSVCAHALQECGILMIDDLTRDDRTKDNPLVTGDPFIRFYAGAPLRTPSGVAIGTLCVIDTIARPGGLTPDQKESLEALARQVMVQLDMRRLLIEHDERARAIEAEARVRKQAEAARRDSEARYQLLFNSLDAGFCVIEMAFDQAGRPRDYKFIEVNAAFAEQTGLADAGGKWMRELAPNHEQHWFDVYGRVAQTGEPVRFENAAEALDGRWFDVHAFRIGPAELRRVAILFNDITVRRKAEQQLQMVNDELGHRMKNSMALVQAIAAQTLRGASDREAVRAFNQRIGALSRAHDVLLQQSWSSADMHEVIKGSLGAHDDKGRVLLHGPEMRLDPKAALSLSLLLHELATNAVKYGSLSVAGGVVDLRWSKTGDILRLIWTESGGPRVSEPSRVGLGTRLIDMGLSGAGTTIKNYAPSGFSVEFNAPLRLIQHAEG